MKPEHVFKVDGLCPVCLAFGYNYGSGNCPNCDDLVSKGQRPMTDEQLVPITEQFPVLKQDILDISELLEENLAGQGLDRFELERVKVGAGGAPGFSFEKPGDEDSDVAKTFDAIVVHHHPSRTYFSEIDDDDSGMGGPPDCGSPDGETGAGNNGTGVGTHRCGECPMGQWGSDPKGGRGQACKAQWTVYLYREGEAGLFPSMLLLPPTSLKGWRGYRTELTSQGYRMTGTLHRFSTRTEPNPDGQKYSIVVINPVRKLSKDELESVRSLADTIKGVVSIKALVPPPKAKPPEDVDYGNIPL